MALPYKNQSTSKKEQIADMFNNISHRYDLLNHVLSMGIDKLWRKKAIRLLSQKKVESLLDIATGTGDFALASMRLNPKKVIGVDISDGMLNVGRSKIKQKGLSHVISFENGDSEKLRFGNNSFDAITVGFGVRNFEHLEDGLSEMLRVLKPGGRVAILEFTKPRKFPVKQLYKFYFKHVLPKIGKMVSKDSSAYTYLPESVYEFPDNEKFIDILKKLGYQKAQMYTLSFGIAGIYLAEKIET